MSLLSKYTSSSSSTHVRLSHSLWRKVVGTACCCCCHIAEAPCKANSTKIVMEDSDTMSGCFFFRRWWCSRMMHGKTKGSDDETSSNLERRKEAPLLPMSCISNHLNISPNPILTFLHHVRTLWKRHSADDRSSSLQLSGISCTRYFNPPEFLANLNSPSALINVPLSLPLHPVRRGGKKKD